MLDPTAAEQVQGELPEAPKHQQGPSISGSSLKSVNSLLTSFSRVGVILTVQETWDMCLVGAKAENENVRLDVPL